MNSYQFQKLNFNYASEEERQKIQLYSWQKILD